MKKRGGGGYEFVEKFYDMEEGFNKRGIEVYRSRFQKRHDKKLGKLDVKDKDSWWWKTYEELDKTEDYDGDIGDFLKEMNEVREELLQNKLLTTDIE